VSILSIIPGLGPAIEKVIDKALSYIPDPVLKEKAASEIRTYAYNVALGQIEVNKLEIGTGKVLGMWRAGLGWALTLSLIWNLIAYPVVVAIILAFDDTFPVHKLPVLDWEQLGGILMGMLGLGG
jgi:hypothetical protein